MKQFDEVRLDSQFARTLRIWNGVDRRSVGKTSKFRKVRELGAVLPGGDWATQFLFQRGSGGVTGM